MAADTPGLVVGDFDFDFGERMIDGNNSCNRSNRVGELDWLRKLDDRNVVVLSSRFGVKQQDIYYYL